MPLPAPAAPMNLSRLAALVCLSACGMLPSCSLGPPPAVAYDRYPNIPDRPVSGMIRNVIKSQAELDRRAFYGRYGGFGDSGGLPVDPLDEVFRRHDIAYHEARSFRVLCWADEAAAVAIDRVDPRNLSPKGQAFRTRSHRFFVTPCWRWIGKPASSWFVWRERPDAPFRNESEVHQFFAFQNPDDANRFAMRRRPQPSGPSTP